MSAKTQHDEICVCAIDAVSRVRVVARLEPLGPDEIKDLVFAFSWDRGIREDDFDALPLFMGVCPLINVMLQTL